MYSLDQIKSEYKDELKIGSLKNILVEYLQYELLDSIYKQKGSENLSFVGGTALRIVYGIQRFSEDLDFDNFGLSYNEFSDLLGLVVIDMKNKGFDVEFRLVEKVAFHCYVKFPSLLYNNNLSENEDEKILIRVDAVSKEKFNQPKNVLLNKFGVYRSILTNHESVILVQKIIAILERKREKGRDFYDVSFLLGKTMPDYEYLKKIKRIDAKELKQILLKRIDEVNLKDLSRDVQPFLINPDDALRITSFKEYIEQVL